VWTLFPSASGTSTLLRREGAVNRVGPQCSARSRMSSRSGGAARPAAPAGLPCEGRRARRL